MKGQSPSAQAQVQAQSQGPITVASTGTQTLAQTQTHGTRSITDQSTITGPLHRYKHKRRYKLHTQETHEQSTTHEHNHERNQTRPAIKVGYLSGK